MVVSSMVAELKRKESAKIKECERWKSIKNVRLPPPTDRLCEKEKE